MDITKYQCPVTTELLENNVNDNFYGNFKNSAIIQTANYRCMAVIWEE